MAMGGEMETRDAVVVGAGPNGLVAANLLADPLALRDGAGGARPLTADDVPEVVRRMEARIEAFAPGFCIRVLARHVEGPADLEAADINLVGGDIGGGTYQLHQQLVFRPWPGLARAETPLPPAFPGVGLGPPRRRSARRVRSERRPGRPRPNVSPGCDASGTGISDDDVGGAEIPVRSCLIAADAAA